MNIRQEAGGDFGSIYALIESAFKTAAVYDGNEHDYYGRFGFVPASRFGIRYKDDVPGEMLDNIMALELIPGALGSIEGVVDL
jgi:predicted N-acetyltransferase YhbS